METTANTIGLFFIEMALEECLVLKRYISFHNRFKYPNV